MQNPPGPPQGTPAASAGVDKRTGALLSYLAQWVTGIIFLFIGKNDPDVKYHAAQSVVLFGGLYVLWIAFGILSGFSFFFGVIRLLLGLVIGVYWLICLYKAWTDGGARFEAPLVGSFIRPYVEQLMNAVR